MRAADVVVSYLNSFAAGDADRIAGHVSDGFRNEHTSELGSSCVGRIEYRRRLPHFLESFADRVYEIDDVIEQVRESVIEVAVRYRFQATYEGVRIDIPGVMWFSVRDAQITKRGDVWDSLTFLRQTGQTTD